MISSVDELGCCESVDFLADDSPLRELVPAGSSERDEMERVLRLLRIALESEVWDD
jgi:hypothetical protein